MPFISLDRRTSTNNVVLQNAPELATFDWTGHWTALFCAPTGEAGFSSWSFYNAHAGFRRLLQACFFQCHFLSEVDFYSNLPRTLFFRFFRHAEYAGRTCFDSGAFSSTMDSSSKICSSSVSLPSMQTMFHGVVWILFPRLQSWLSCASHSLVPLFMGWNSLPMHGSHGSHACAFTWP